MLFRLVYTKMIIRVYVVYDCMRISTIIYNALYTLYTMVNNLLSVCIYFIYIHSYVVHNLIKEPVSANDKTNTTIIIPS